MLASEVPTNASAAPTSPEQAPVRLRRPRQRNWESAEILALIRAKAIEHHASRNVVNARARIETAQQKWMRISKVVMAERVSPQERDDSACMTKWNSLYGEFKKIKDYHTGTCNNLSYWNMTREE
jgi:hypothetical protein